MAGYTPLFSSLTTGTLCGKWPDIGLWPIVLSLADRLGVVDVTPDYLSRVTGLAVDAIVACMQRFCQPDPYSRSQEKAGARLELLDSHRDWGWRVINHSLYRERARKQTHDQQRQATGANAARMAVRRYQEKPTREDPTQPAITRSPDSDSNTDSDKREKGRGLGREKRASAPATHLPEDFRLTAERKATAEAEHLDAEREFAKFCDHWHAKSGSDARKRDWDATWRNWCRSDIAARSAKARAGPAEPVRTWEPPDEDEHAQA